MNCAYCQTERAEKVLGKVLNLHYYIPGTGLHILSVVRCFKQICIAEGHYWTHDIFPGVQGHLVLIL